LIIIYANRYNLEAECEVLLITGFEVLSVELVKRLGLTDREEWTLIFCERSLTTNWSTCCTNTENLKLCL